MTILFLIILMFASSQQALDLAKLEPKEASAVVARMALHPAPGDAEALLPLLQSDNASLKRAALRAMGFIGGPESLGWIQPLAADTDAGVRIGYLFAVLRLNGNTAADQVGVLLADPDPRVRLAAQATATRLGLGDHREQLRSALAGQDLALVQIAAPALARLGEAGLVVPLLGSSTDEVRNIAAQALLDAPPEGEIVTGLFLALEKETYGYVTAQMVQTAVYLGRHDPGALAVSMATSRRKGALMAESKTYAEHLRVVAAACGRLKPEADDTDATIDLLRVVGGPETVKVLRAFAFNPTVASQRRVPAIRALADLGDQDSIAGLRKLASASEPFLAASSTYALGTLGDRVSGPVIRANLAHPTSRVRQAALTAIQRLGLIDAIDEVEKLKSDPEAQVRQQAAQVLIALQKEAAVNDPVYRLGHDTILVQAGGKNIYFDPFQLPDGLPKADLVLVTHDHHDHLSPDDIKKIASEKTVLVVPKAFASKAAGLAGKVTAVAAGEMVPVEGFEVRAVPAYNPGKKFHPKEYGGVGYFVKVGAVTYYHAGDTDLIPEMKGFPSADVCFLPVSGTYVMTAAEAAEATKVLKCGKAVPMHYGAIIGGDKDAEEFKRLASCPVEVLPKTEKVP